MVGKLISRSGAQFEKTRVPRVARQLPPAKLRAVRFGPHMYVSFWASRLWSGRENPSKRFEHAWCVEILRQTSSVRLIVQVKKGSASNDLCKISYYYSFRSWESGRGCNKTVDCHGNVSHRSHRHSDLQRAPLNS